MTLEQYGYEIKNWIDRLQSIPVEVIRSIDVSPSYEMDRFTIFRLENNKYATVQESGCSCYTCNDANIKVHENAVLAENAYQDWKQGHYSKSQIEDKEKSS